jgi:hypothetical protein
MISAAITAVFYIAFAPPMMGCNKTVTKTDTVTVTKTDTVTKTINDTTYFDAVCPVRGSYSGTNTSHTGVNSTCFYTFRDNNMVVGQDATGKTDVIFGSYKNTCDSVILSVYYVANSNYYILQAKFSNNMNTISGTFTNVTTPSDYGTFTMSK